MAKEKNENFLDALTQVQELSVELLANKMLDVKECYTHTEIHNPTAMTTMDVSSDFFQTLKIDDVINAYRKWIRINFIAYNRQRAKEMVEILRSIRLEQQQKPLTWSEALMGKR